jgi:hypothetical protein
MQVSAPELFDGRPELKLPFPVDDLGLDLRQVLVQGLQSNL